MSINIRTILLLILVLFFSACVGNTTPEYMYREWKDWPKSLNDIEKCTEITGTYLDGEPNHSGAYPPSVWAFRLPHENIRHKDKTVISREIEIHFDTKKTLYIEYNIDGKRVAMKQFEPSQYSCTEKGLELILQKHSGQLDRKIPNPGFNTLKGTIYQVDDYLYVHNRLDTTSLIFYIIPNISYTEYWNRFLVKKVKKI